MQKDIKFFDKNILRKAKLVNNSYKNLDSSFVPLPSVVEISDSGTCNRKCSFCPRSDPDYKDVKEFITPELHDKICMELNELEYNGQLIYSGFNEPLLNKQIYRNIKSARGFLPKAKIELITNGDVLNLNRLKRLINSGLSTILISVYDGEEDYIKFKNLVREANLEPSQYVIRKRYLPQEQDFGITINNRGGEMKNAEHSIAPLKSPLNTKCNYPSYYFFIDYTGEVLMCSHDWGKKNVLGNIKYQTLLEIWMSELAMKSRIGLCNGKRNFAPCNVCDVAGSLMGEKHSNAWIKYYEK